MIPSLCLTILSLSHDSEFVLHFKFISRDSKFASFNSISFHHRIKKNLYIIAILLVLVFLSFCVS